MKIRLKRSMLLLLSLGALLLLYYMSGLMEERPKISGPRSAAVPWAPPKKRRGRFKGSNGQHIFYSAKAREWEVDPRLVRQMCQATNFTQCNPPARRTEQEKRADRAARKPFRVVIHKEFHWDPTIPKFSGKLADICVPLHLHLNSMTLKFC